MTDDEYSTGKAYNETTILKDGSGQKTGLRGEKKFSDWLMRNRFTFTSCGSQIIDYDFVIHLPNRRITVDVKAKRRYVPYNHECFEGHVNESQEGFICDCYVFASVHDDGVYFGGWITKKAFWARCERVKKGELTVGGKIEDADAGKLKHTELKDMDSFLDLLRRVGGTIEGKRRAEGA